MKAYVYWPFARQEDREMFLAIGAVDHSNEFLIHVIDRLGNVSAGSSNVDIRRDLPEVSHLTGLRRPMVPVSRAHTYLQRSATRTRRIRDFKPDICHIAFTNVYTDPILLPRLSANRPVICTIHDVLPHSSNLPLPAHRALMSRIIDSSHGVIVHDRAVADDLSKHFGTDPRKVHVVPHWVSQHRSHDELLQLPPDPHVLFFGALRTNKGLDVFIQAAELLKDTAIRFTIAGRGDRRLESLAQEAAERLPNLMADIRYILPGEKQRLHRSAHLVVMPYTSFHSQSGVLHDAYGSHTPVIVTDVGGLGSSVLTNQTGRVVPLGEPDALADGISSILADGEEWIAASAASRTVALSRAPAMFAKDLLAAYTSVMEHASE